MKSNSTDDLDQRFNTVKQKPNFLKQMSNPNETSSSAIFQITISQNASEQSTNPKIIQDMGLDKSQTSLASNFSQSNTEIVETEINSTRSSSELTDNNQAHQTNENSCKCETVGLESRSVDNPGQSETKTNDHQEGDHVKQDYRSILMKRLLSDNQTEQNFDRILLLIELLQLGMQDTRSTEYDQMKEIMNTIERNSRLQEGEQGKWLSDRARTAKSNRNFDIDCFDEEIHYQFGLKSIEVVGDGSCAFRSVAISGLHVSDKIHVEIRKKVIKYVSDNPDYYRTVLRPGETVSEKELKRWVSSMMDLETYSDELALIALADVYHMQLVIFRAGELLVVVNPRDGNIVQTAFLLNVGTHYRALVPNQEYFKACFLSERLQKNK